MKNGKKRGEKLLSTEEKLRSVLAWLTSEKFVAGLVQKEIPADYDTELHTSATEMEDVEALEIVGERHGEFIEKYLSPSALAALRTAEVAP